MVFAAAIALMLSAPSDPDITDPALRAAPKIISREEWGAKPPVLDLPPHTIDRITVHHTGVRQNRERTFFDKLRGLQAWSQREDQLAGGRTKPQWADIPYHFYIDWQGEIAEARPISLPGDTNTSYDVRGHALIVVEGTFPTDTFNAQQRRALYQLTLHLARTYSVWPHRIKGHVDYTPGETDCPGDSIIHELPYLRLFVATHRDEVSD